jgi:hypothetical protein
MTRSGRTESVGEGIRWSVKRDDGGWRERLRTVAHHLYRTPSPAAESENPFLLVLSVVLGIFLMSTVVGGMQQQISTDIPSFHASRQAPKY